MQQTETSPQRSNNLVLTNDIVNQFHELINMKKSPCATVYRQNRPPSRKHLVTLELPPKWMPMVGEPVASMNVQAGTYNNFS